MNWKNKRVLVTGNLGMIGKELVIQLKEKGAITIGLDIKETGWDVTKTEDVEIIFKGLKEKGLLPDYIFHLFGIKGNPKMTNERPVDFMGPMLQGDTNMILAAQKYGIKRFLYTSSIAVENPETDKYPAWAKQTGETLIEAMRIQYPKGTKYTIVRPSNVYGRYDNFDNPNAMVVTKLIKEALTKGKIILDINGAYQVRDIINAKDVARGMIQAMEEMPKSPVNLCSGKEFTIEDIAQIIQVHLDKADDDYFLQYKNLNLVLGPERKTMKNPYINPEISLNQGIKEVIDYVKNK